jgi:hypothetical protein
MSRKKGEIMEETFLEFLKTVDLNKVLPEIVPTVAAARNNWIQIKIENYGKRAIDRGEK